jgi:hypothetical protein
MNDELDNMKNLWQQSTLIAPALDAGQIETLLTTRSKSALTRLRTNLLFELVVGMGVMAVLLLGAVRTENQSARFAIAQLVFLMIPYFIFYYTAFKNLNKGISWTSSLRQMLEHAITFWQTSLRLYFVGSVLLMPVLFIIVRWWRLETFGTGTLQFFTGSTTMIWVKSILAWGLLAAMIWGLIRLSYGKYVDKLKGCLEELEGQR